MSFDSYQRALKRGKQLSIGELVNLMKYRAGGRQYRSRQLLPSRSIRCIRFLRGRNPHSSLQGIVRLGFRQTADAGENEGKNAGFNDGPDHGICTVYYIL
jgi:hypothetical protein